MHPYQVNDRRTGTIVCTDCALVLENIDLETLLINQPSYNLESSAICFKLREFCCNGNISESIENETFAYFTNVMRR